MKLFFARRKRGECVTCDVIFFFVTFASYVARGWQGSIDFVVQSLNIPKYHGETSVLNSKWELLLVVTL